MKQNLLTSCEMCAKHTHTHTHVLYFKDWRYNVVPSMMKGGVKLDNALTRDRL